MLWQQTNSSRQSPKDGVWRTTKALLRRLSEKVCRRLPKPKLARCGATEVGHLCRSSRGSNPFRGQSGRPEDELQGFATSRIDL